MTSPEEGGQLQFHNVNNTGSVNKLRWNLNECVCVSVRVCGRGRVSVTEYDNHLVHPHRRIMKYQRLKRVHAQSHIVTALSLQRDTIY